MNIHIETERLVIRDIIKDDLQDMYELHADPEVHKYLGNTVITTIEEATKIITDIRQQYIDFGIGRWAIIDKSTHEFIGWTGLKYETELRKGFAEYDLGYRLRKKYWGKGIATETAIESLKYGFEKLKLEKICAAADIDNGASNRILTKVGLSLVEVFEYEAVDHNWYEITKDDWLIMDRLR